MKITKTTQEKLEAAFKAIGYKIRYEKGTFKSGYCLIEEQKVVVVNKFYPLESKVIAMAEIMRELNPDNTGLDDTLVKIVTEVLKTQTNP